MYTVYDELGYWVARCADFNWAKKTADHYNGWVKEMDGWGDEWICYDATEDVFGWYIDF